MSNELLSRKEMREKNDYVENEMFKLEGIMRATDNYLDKVPEGAKQDPNVVSYRSIPRCLTKDVG